MSLDYEYIEVPGSSRIRIPLVKRNQDLEEDATGTRVPDWMFCIEGGAGLTKSVIKGYEKYSEVFGWYCESSRHVKGDTTNNLYTSATLWHSDIFLVVQNSNHIAFVKNSIASGHISPEIILIRLTRINNVVQIVQTLTFNTCHWLAIHAHLDWSILRFTACKRTNSVNGFDQDGNPTGQSTFIVNYATNSTS